MVDEQKVERKVRAKKGGKSEAKWAKIEQKCRESEPKMSGKVGQKEQKCWEQWRKRPSQKLGEPVSHLAE